jgi:hypothetical protein
MKGDWLEGVRVDPTGSGQMPLVSCCKYGDKPVRSGTTELVTTMRSKLVLCTLLWGKRLECSVQP